MNKSKLEVDPEVELYKYHKQLVEEQGRRPAWIAKKLNCSYSLVYQYLNGLKSMSKERVEKLHNLLTK